MITFASWRLKMTKEVIFLIEESVEGGYEARAMGYSIFTEGETYEEVKENIKEAIKCHFEENEIPNIIRI
jgi:hypothetical protein